VENLKAYPERQMKDFLGQGSPEEYKACCLGELLLCKYRAQKKKLPFIGGELYSGKSEDAVACLDNYKSLGLLSNTGEIRADVADTYPEGTLAELNDLTSTWPEIAAFVEANPDHFFTKSV
jgi:hypothetical protein